MHDDSDQDVLLRVSSAALRKIVHALANEGAGVSGIAHLLHASPSSAETSRLLRRLDARSRSLQAEVQNLRRLITHASSGEARSTGGAFAPSTDVDGSPARAAADTRPAEAPRATPTPPPLAPAEVVDDTYVIEEQLGEGAMGTVYRARDLALERRVAVKLLTASHWASPATRDAFLREARSLAQIRHANVVGVHAFGTRDDNPFIVMDLIDGPTLRDLLRESQLEVEQALDLLVQLCSGLAALHTAGLVHRDIKPANLMVDTSGCLSITDLGLALPLETDLDPSIHLRGGTPGYSAPEVFRRDERMLTRRVDVYGVGAVAFEVLGGHRAFPTADPKKRLQDQARGPHRTLGSLCPDMPASLTELIDECLSPAPEERPADVEVVREALVAAAVACTRFDDLRVVVVDDDGDALQHTVSLLRRQLHGCTITTHQHASEALRAVDQTPPDIVVTDLEMPGMDGLLLIGRLREVHDLPVLVVSGVGGPDAWRRARRAGANAFLPKPLDARSLGAVVRSLVASPTRPPSFWRGAITEP